MEYWYNSLDKTPEEVNQILDCQLYSATDFVDVNHYTHPKIITDLHADTLFEAAEVISMFDPKKEWIINTNDNLNITFDVIKQVIKNKKDLPHIQLCPMFRSPPIREYGWADSDHASMIQEMLTTISYGVDYIYIESDEDNMPKHDNWINDIHWIREFRDKGFYKTKIMVDSVIHRQYIFSYSPIDYDGVVWSNKGIMN